jgi:hypothetical protein
MEPTSEARPATTRVTGALLIASGIVFTAGVVPQPSAITNLYETETLAQAYAVVEAHAGAYQWGNLAAGLAAVIALLGTWRLHRRPGNRRAVERVAVVGLAAATVGWLVEVAVRVSLVVGRADDSSAGRSGSYLADHALDGDGAFLIVSLVYALSLLAFAVVWARDHVVGRVSAGILAVSSLASAALVQSDPVAIAFLPPFTFWLGLPAIGISLIRGTRARRGGQTADVRRTPNEAPRPPR